MRVMAVGAHPDDVELMAGGTLARYVKRGDETAMVYMCNGNMGHVEIPPDELVEIRKEESRQATEVIGAKMYWFDNSDFTTEVVPKRTLQLVDAIRDFKPDMVITHSTEDYIRDHVNTGHLVFKASFDASVPHVESENPHHDKIVPIFEMDTLFGLRFVPTEYVDVSDVIEIKQRALACHKSQVQWLKDHDKVDVVEDMLTASRYRGLQCGVRYAEAFRQIQVWGRTTIERLLP